MNLESTHNQSIDIIHTLTESNAQLIRMTDDGIGEAIDSTKKYMELIHHCGKIYQYLSIKNNKWELLKENYGKDK